MPTIRFSIIITFYNQRAFIKDALDSALSLGFADKQIIAVDDGSTDGSQSVLEQYGNTICLVCQTNQGACAARNAGAAIATGEYLVFLDGDDAFLPWALDVYEHIVRARKPKLILGEMRWFIGNMPAATPGDSPHEIQVVEYKDYLRRDRAFGNSASALVIDRLSFESVHGWPTGLFPCDDHDLALKLGTSGRTIQILEPPTVFHRAHSISTTQNLSGCLRAVYAFVQRERAGQYPGGKPRSRERRALIGGVVFFFLKRAIESGMYGDAIRLFTHNWPMVLAAVMRRLGVILRGRQPCETIKI